MLQASVSTMIDRYYFDVLPLHPSPKNLETLTCYLTRIAEINGIKHLDDLSKTMALEKHVFKQMTDYPLVSFGEIASRTVCSESRILATTFFYMAKKFGCSVYPAFLQYFFKGSLGAYLRYCPLCIDEMSYYSLIWRFLCLPGCALHESQFLECCLHCDNPIPLLVLPSKIGLCPTCKGDLRACKALPLLEEGIQMIHQYRADIESLLSQNFDENEGDASKRAGYKFAVLRRERQLSPQQVALATGIPLHEVYGMEQGGMHKRTSFQSYVKYADYFGIPLYSLFEYSEGEQERVDTQKKHIDVVFEHVQGAIQDLNSRKEAVTLTAIGKYVNISPNRINQYNSIEAINKETLLDLQIERRKRKKQQKENVLIERLYKAITILTENGRFLSQESISEQAELSPVQLSYYASARALLIGYPLKEPRLSKRLGEDYVIELVNTAIASLISLEQAVTLMEISRKVKLSIYKLRSYPKVKIMLDNIVKEKRPKVTI